MKALSVALVLCLMVGIAFADRVSLSGTVLDYNTGVPVAGAWVTVGTKRVISEANGSYTFTGLLPGTYWVSAWSEGYLAGGATFLLGTTDVIGANIFIKSLVFISVAEDVRGMETVEVSEEGITVGMKTIVSGVLDVPPEEAIGQFAAILVIAPGVVIKDAQGNVVTAAPMISVTYLERSQCPLPATGTFGMNASDVYKSPGTKQTVTTDIVIDGVRTELTVEGPHDLLNEGSVMRASNVPFAAFVLEGNGEQGWTFSEPQVLTGNPARFNPPIDLLSSGLPPGTKIPFVDADGEIVYGTLREVGSIRLWVSVLTTYLMQANFNFEVTSSELEASVKAGKIAATKPAGSQSEISSSTNFDFEGGIDPLTQMYLRVLIVQYLEVPEEVLSAEVILGENQEIVEVRTVSRLTIEIVIGEGVIASYGVTITAIDGVVQSVPVAVEQQSWGKVKAMFR